MQESLNFLFFGVAKIAAIASKNGNNNTAPNIGKQQMEWCLQAFKYNGDISQQMYTYRRRGAQAPHTHSQTKPVHIIKRYILGLCLAYVMAVLDGVAVAVAVACSV